MLPEKKFTRRHFLHATGLALTGIAAAACTQPTPTAAPKPTAKPAEATVPTVEPTTVAPTAAPTTQTIRLSHWWSEEQLAPVFDTFQQGHPDIKLQVEAVPWDGYNDRLVTQVAAGNAPDVAFADAGTFPRLIVEGVFREITELLQSDGQIDPKKWAIDPALDSGYQGRAYGLPQWHPDSPNVYVNKELFDKEGIKVPDYGSDDFMKWDWDTFLDAAKALTKRAVDGKAEQWGVAGIGRSVWGPHRDMVWTNGAEFFDDVTALDAKEARFTDPLFVEAWQWLVDLEMKHHVTTAPEDEQAFGTEGAFLSGKVAMTFGWNGYDWYAKANFEWTVIAPPFEKRITNKYGGNSWFIPKSTVQGKVAASWAVIKWLTTDIEGEKAMTTGGFSCYNPEALLPFAKTDMQRKLWATIVNRQKATVADDAARPYGLGLHGAEIETILNSENDLIYVGKQTVEESLAKAKQQVDEILAS